LLEKYLKKLIGKTDIEDALKRLDKLTNEEVRMVTAQVLEATHAVDDRVGRVGDGVLDVSNKVAGVDDRVARVDERVAGVDERVAGVDEYVKVIDDKVAVVIDGAQLPLISQQQNIFNDDVFRGKRDKGSHGSSETFVVFFLRYHWCSNSTILTGNQLRHDLRKWLSPSDPSINHNIACGAHRKQRAEWFFQGSIFTKWKSDGSLLWLHGKRTFSSYFQPDGR
jgi:hypothetical protein